MEIKTVLSSVYSESKLLTLSTPQLLDTCSSILRNDKDESLRGEAVWVLGKIIKEFKKDDLNHKKIEDLLEKVLLEDDNPVVKHEACFQLGENNLKNKTSALVNSALHDPSELVRHEAIEALGLLQAFECKDLLHQCLKDTNEAVRQTAVFVIKQLERLRIASD